MEGDCEELLKDGQIRNEVVEDLLVEVISGKSIFQSQNELYASHSPSMGDQDKARIIYTRRLHECRKLGLPTRANLEVIALERGFFDLEEREEARSLEGMVIRSLKARESTHDPRQKVELAAEIEKLRLRIHELRFREEEVFVHSAESKSDDTRVNYLVSHCTLTGELLDEPLWDWKTYQECSDYALLGDARRAFMRAWHGLPIKIIRALARTQEWRTRWKASRETGTPVFEQASGDWDANKRQLAWWTDFYDSVHKHPEAPSDEIIRNDEHLQDWLNNQVSRRTSSAPRASSKPPPTYLDGHGQRHRMVRVGESTTQVAQPYKVRV